MHKEFEDLYSNRDSRNYIHMGEPRALYWCPYRRTYEQLKGFLQEGQPIPDSLPVVLVGNNTLHPFHFDLKKTDRGPVGNFTIPGKSAHIAFDTNIHVIIGAILDRQTRRQDHAYILPAAEMLKPTGYIAFFTPQGNQPLHIRLVHESHIGNPYLDQVAFKYRKALAELFQRYCINHCE